MRALCGCTGPACRPVAHHDIDADIPPATRGMVRLGYLTWLATAAGYLWNWFCITLMCAASPPLGGTQASLSVTQRALSVTQRALSVTQ